MTEKAKRLVLTVCVCVLSVILVAAVGFAIYLGMPSGDIQTTTQAPSDGPLVTAPQPTYPTETTAETTTVTTEPQPIRYTLSFAGDCTIANDKNGGGPNSFIGTVGNNYAYPFADVLPYFSKDDCTFVNLECALTNRGTMAEKRFNFRGPPEYVNILTEGSVEFANVVNNHAYDYGKVGYQDTLDILDEKGIYYAQDKDTVVFTTQSGLTIGVYAHNFPSTSAGFKAKFDAMRAKGAEIVIACFHWGDEGYYKPNQTQIKLARAAIDAGADIVYGHHPHVLQPIEEYNGGVIFYSLGNFSFGGNSSPSDKDSAILQQEIIREPDGSVHLGELTIIPVHISGILSWGNDYQPTPMEPDSDTYARALRKLNGTHPVIHLYVPYRDGPEATESTGSTGTTEPSVPGGVTGATEPSTPSGTTGTTEPAEPSETTGTTEPAEPSETTGATEPPAPSETTGSTQPAEPSPPAETTGGGEASSTGETTGE